MHDELAKHIGKEVRKQREYLGLTQDAASELLGISPQFLSEIERGIKGISADTLYKICTKLSISADTVLPGKRASANTSALIELIATLDEKYIPILEDIIKSFVKAISLKVT